MFLGMTHHYRNGDLVKQGKVIDLFRVAGVLAKHGLGTSFRVGNTTLEARHLPDEVQMRTDNMGLVSVAVQEKKREVGCTYCSAGAS